MAWDKTLPADTSQLRLGPSYIRDNWDAIETADTSLGQTGVNLSEQAGDLALFASTYRLYSKDSGGNTELFGINSNGDVTQFSKESSTLAASGNIFIPGGLFAQWRTQSVTSGNSVSFPTAFGAAPYYVNFIVQGTPANNRLYQRISGTPTAAAFTPLILNTSGLGITATIKWFAFGVPA